MHIKVDRFARSLFISFVIAFFCAGMIGLLGASGPGTQEYASQLSQFVAKVFWGVFIALFVILYGVQILIGRLRK